MYKRSLILVIVNKYWIMFHTITFLLTDTENWKLHEAGRDYAVSILTYIFPRKFVYMKILPTNRSEVKIIIHSFKSKSSWTYDGTRKIFKASASLICCPLTHICNYSLFTGIFPDHLKISIAKPLYNIMYRLVHIYVYVYSPRLVWLQKRNPMKIPPLNWHKVY